MLRWCDAVNKYNFVIQHRSGVKHQNADAMSRLRLTKSGWTECPDCKGGFPPFADEDESVLTRHDEELIIKPISAPRRVLAEVGVKAHSELLSLRTENVQANVPGPHRSNRIAGKLSTHAPAAIMSKGLGSKDEIPQPIVQRGKATYAQRAQKSGNSMPSTQKEPQGGNSCVRAPAVAVERADAVLPPCKRGRGRPKKILEPTAAKAPNALEKVGEAEEPDILVAQRAMQCPDWVRAQHADPVIKQLKG